MTNFNSLFGNDEYGELHVVDNEGMRVIPTYTCGHCSNIVMMRPDRQRERKRCLHCMRLICEKTDLCSTQCTPLPAMARDHFENTGEHSKFVDAIMQGCVTIDEGKSKGLII